MIALRFNNKFWAQEYLDDHSCEQCNNLYSTNLLYSTGVNIIFVRSKNRKLQHVTRTSFGAGSIKVPAAISTLFVTLYSKVMLFRALSCTWRGYLLLVKVGERGPHACRMVLSLTSELLSRCLAASSKWICSSVRFPRAFLYQIFASTYARSYGIRWQDSRRTLNGSPFDECSPRNLSL